ncbi:hypothetical protein QI339_12410 [Staphylococcus saprophyticus]|nr:hypothetical protein [Staphylococcus saprophyticus]
MTNEHLDESQNYKRFPIMLPNQLKKELKIIAEKEGHKSLSSFIRSEMIKIRNNKKDYLIDSSDTSD